MKQIFYQIIYNEKINFFLRNLNKVLSPILPKKIKIPPSGIFKINMDDGLVLKIKTNQTSCLTQPIFWEGYRNYEYTDIFINLVKKTHTFFDIGANIGYYSLLAAIENKSIKVIGFEPAEGSLFYYKENITINNFNNIIIEPIAISDRDGEIEFYELINKKYTYLKHHLSGESNVGSGKVDGSLILKKVKTTTLDNYVKLNNVSKLDLIKMDTEGNEHFILQGANMVLSEIKPIIICETLFNKIEPDLDKIMRSYGYEFYNHSQNRLIKTETLIRNTDNGVRNCFFVHPEKLDLIAEFLE
ncbi:MAG: FkbM family methyltransferase [Bacteroidales bacterium]|nr:FkbM family methyltransferase [Bacteroidales bacterium]